MLKKTISEGLSIFNYDIYLKKKTISEGQTLNTYDIYLKIKQSVTLKSPFLVITLSSNMLIYVDKLTTFDICC